jgi:hypothetical protein
VTLRTGVAVLAAVATLMVASGARSQAPTTVAGPISLSVTVVAADRDDPRWSVAAEAVEFWNQELADVGAGVRLGPISRMVQPVPNDALGQLSAAVLGSRRDHEIPGELQAIPGDILVALSTGDFVSFALRWSRARKGLVGIRQADSPPLSRPNVLRNVIAHELGHVLGLRHNSDPTTLMCGRPAPCRPDVFASRSPRFFPLTDADRTALRQTSW